MNYKTFGNLKITSVVMGTDCFGAEMEPDLCERLLDLYIDQGGNTIDTARSYSIWSGDFTPGQSERVIGNWLKKRGKRDGLVISTKCAHPASTKRMDIPRLSEKDIFEDVEGSLRDLGTDYIDILWLHRDNKTLPVSEIMESLHKLVKQGKVLNVGASNWTAERICQANDYAVKNNLTPFCGSQIKWALCKTASDINIVQDVVEMTKEEYAFYKETKMPVFAFASQAKGFMYKMAMGGIEALSPKARERYFCPENVERFQKVMAYCKESGVSLESAVLSSLIGNPYFETCAIVGCKNEKQLLSSISGADAKIDYDFFEKLMF